MSLPFFQILGAWNCYTRLPQTRKLTQSSSRFYSHISSFFSLHDLSSSLSYRESRFECWVLIFCKFLAAHLVFAFFSPIFAYFHLCFKYFLCFQRIYSGIHGVIKLVTTNGKVYKFTGKVDKYLIFNVFSVLSLFHQFYLPSTEV